MIKRSAALAALMAALLAGQPALSEAPKAKAPPAMTTPKKAALPEGVLVLKRASIPDPGVIAQRNAMTVLIPEGWTTKGGVEAKTNLCSEIFGVNWTATAPDGPAQASERMTSPAAWPG